MGAPSTNQASNCKDGTGRERRSSAWAHKAGAIPLLRSEAPLSITSTAAAGTDDPSDAQILIVWSSPSGAAASMSIGRMGNNTGVNIAGAPVCANTASGGSGGKGETAQERAPRDTGIAELSRSAEDTELMAGNREMPVNCARKATQTLMVQPVNYINRESNNASN